MSTWESEMTPAEWEQVMGVPYSHISPEEGESNRKMMDTVQEILDQLAIKQNWKNLTTDWCSCNYASDSYSFYIPPNEHCLICQLSIDNDHYHCGVCTKITQVG